MVQAVLFDMGGVLVTSPFAGFARYERRVALPDGFIRQMNAVDPDHNTWARFERGEIDRKAFVAAYEADALRLGHRIDAEEVLDSLRAEVIEPMVAAVGRIRAVARTGLLTNNLHPLDPHSPLAGRLLPLFDVIVQSAVERVRKPDPRFYELACERLGVEPAECVFLDDLGVNCKPARALGMYTIKVVNPLDALAELEEILELSLR